MRGAQAIIRARVVGTTMKLLRFMKEFTKIRLCIAKRKKRWVSVSFMETTLMKSKLSRHHSRILMTIVST